MFIRVLPVLALSALVAVSCVSASLDAESPPTVAAAPPVEPPSTVCDNRTQGPAAPPPGAVIVNPVDTEVSVKTDTHPPGTTFWLAPGVHTLGTNQFGQVGPKDGNTYIGAPGAILDGRGVNRYAFTGRAADVTIKHLEIRGFITPRDEGVVNHDMGEGWLVEHNWMHHNKGGAVFVATDNVLRHNCIEDNGQYGFQGIGHHPGPNNLTIDGNEVARNNTDDWEHQGGGCGCTGGAKFWITNNAKVINNWVHDNHSVGLWFDNNNRNAVVENNLIEGNFAQGLFVEAGYDVKIHNNTLRKNAVGVGQEFANRGDMFPIGAIYVSENGSPLGSGLKTQPMIIGHNNFHDNWGGVVLWENSDRYCSSAAHTHPPACTIKVDLYDDAQCETDVENDIPDAIDKYRCRWSTEHVIVEHNTFTIDKVALSCVDSNFCGVSGIFSNAGSFPEFPAYEIPWRMTFQQGNVFRNNNYQGDWRFAGFEVAKPNGGRVTWADWTAPAPPIPDVFTHDNRPTTFGQDAGSTFGTS